MKITRPKRILIALSIGLVLSFLSLLYFRETTMIDYSCQGVECAQLGFKNVAVSVRGFPFSAVVLNQDSSIKYITTSLFIGNWLLYSAIVFIGLQFWRPKPKVA